MDCHVTLSEAQVSSQLTLWREGFVLHYGRSDAKSSVSNSFASTKSLLRGKAVVPQRHCEDERSEDVAVHLCLLYPKGHRRHAFKPCANLIFLVLSRCYHFYTLYVIRAKNVLLHKQTTCKERALCRLLSLYQLLADTVWFLVSGVKAKPIRSACRAVFIAAADCCFR